MSIYTEFRDAINSYNRAYINRWGGGNRLSPPPKDSTMLASWYNANNGQSVNRIEYRSSPYIQVGAGTYIIKEHLDRVIQAKQDIEDLRRCNSCSGTCSQSCSANCGNSCGAGCYTGCTGCTGCGGCSGCSGGSGDSCGSGGCFCTNWMQACGGCDHWCNGCSGCSGCSGNCQSSCGGGCTSCSGGCGGSCHGSCQSGCSRSCSSGCSYSSRIGDV